MMTSADVASSISTHLLIHTHGCQAQELNIMFNPLVAYTNLYRSVDPAENSSHRHSTSYYHAEVAVGWLYQL
jgi:hypothetical protein